MSDPQPQDSEEFVPDAGGPEDPAYEDESSPEREEAAAELAEVVQDDEADIAVGAASRALEAQAPPLDEPAAWVRPEAVEEPAADTAAVAQAATPTGQDAVADIAVLREYEREVHEVIVELNRIEADVRALIDERDAKRKRKLSGTHRWHELEEDLLSWQFSGRFDPETIRRAQELIARRHFLFRHLRFLAGTRPVWNS